MQSRQQRHPGERVPPGAASARPVAPGRGRAAPCCGVARPGVRAPDRRADAATAGNLAMQRQRCWRWLLFGALLLAAGLGLDGLWIHARAAMAQLLPRYMR